MSEDRENLINLARNDRKRMYELLGIKTGYSVTQIHTLLLQTAGELCWLAEQSRADRESALSQTNEARYGAATILLVVASLEGAIHSAAAMVGEKYAAELPTLELSLPNGKRTRVPPRELSSCRRVSLVTKWRDVPRQLTIPAIVAPNPDGSTRTMSLSEGAPELKMLQGFVETRNKLLQHHHALVEPMPLNLIRFVSQDEDADHVFPKHSTERYSAVEARQACILAADLISALHDRLGLREYWSADLERVLRHPLMTITNCTLEDFNQIFTDIADFWGHDRTRYLHHPMYVREFGNTAYVIKDGDTVTAYLFGFLSQTRPAAYVKFVGVRAACRRRGLARSLYEHFIAYAKTQGCTELRAITSPANADSIAFHRALGMELLGEPNEDGVPVIKDYAGPGRDRVVFTKTI